MTTARIDAIGLVAADLGRSVAFYRALGYEVPEPTPETGGHLDIQLDGFRLMLDTEDVVRSFDPDWSGSGSGRVSQSSHRTGAAWRTRSRPWRRRANGRWPKPSRWGVVSDSPPAPWSK